jgi:UDP-glucuronate 4-epimerase
LVRTIEQSLGKTANIDWQPLQPGDVSITYANIAKARDLLGYNPQTKIADGIPKFVQWYLAQKQ